MKLRTKIILVVIANVIIWSAVNWMVNKTKEISYLQGYDDGYNDGYDTATVIREREFKPLFDSIQMQKNRVQLLFHEVDSASVTSFPNHSEITP